MMSLEGKGVLFEKYHVHARTTFEFLWPFIIPKLILDQFIVLTTYFRQIDRCTWAAGVADQVENRRKA